MASTFVSVGFLMVAIDCSQTKIVDVCFVKVLIRVQQPIMEQQIFHENVIKNGEFIDFWKTSNETTVWYEVLVTNDLIRPMSYRSSLELWRPVFD